MWDENRLERVLHNLLDNAQKYSPNEGEITITLKQEDNSALIEVSDSGIGIPLDDQEHIFDWFRRGANIASVAPGTGVGLAGARQIVEQHGGTITVRSRVGRGSTFVVRLPLA
jgi:signal transduction histidine kinase